MGFQDKLLQVGIKNLKDELKIMYRLREGKEIKQYRIEFDTNLMLLELEVEFVHGIYFKSKYELYKDLNIKEVNYEKSLHVLKQNPQILSNLLIKSIRNKLNTFYNK